MNHDFQIPNNLDSLSLSELSKGMIGITQPFGQSTAEAASICLEEQNHRNGVHLFVNNEFNKIFSVIWDDTTDQMRRTWADHEVTTEYGAYGIAFLLIQDLTNLIVLERSCKGTGFDFWLGPKFEEELLFQNKARLEVSGIRKGNESDIQSRVKQKIKQTSRSNGSLPAYIIVVEFGKPQSVVTKKDG